MVTAKTTKSTSPKIKVPRTTSITIRENAKKDHSPNWNNASELSGDEFAKYFRFAMSFYNLNHSGKDLKPKVLLWMDQAGYDKKIIAAYKATKDWRSSLTTGAIASCLLRGMPDSHNSFNQGRSFSEWLRKDITVVIDAGKYDIVDAPIEKGALKIDAVPVLNIQERIREQAGLMSEEIDLAIDSWITNPDGFDPKAFKMVSLLRGKGVKSSHARYIRSFFARGSEEVKSLASGTADVQLKEAYQHLPRKHVKKLIEFYESIASACDQIAAEAKILKKPRTAKIKPAEDLVKKLKYKMTDDKLGVTSVPAAGLIGAQGAIVYNSKTRKIGLYIAKSSAGFGVKGTTLTEYTEKSIQKTLRKPTEQLKELKEQNTQRRVEAWITKIKATDTMLNGRMNADIMILRIFK